ncbi:MULTISPECIES: hypothetical protein [Bacillus]|uniref:Uncharacterized protein n=1 Tax=Bacillus cereus TaxID=1396 RepID=A0A164PBW6_BACCE|nr:MULTISPECIES: hypothetical protein [Bacillus]KZD66766.1 hypothetical protein B4088_1977 [Bacillus cereus]TSI22014.1 hypothetical protein FOT98_05475 [Bacillus sp. HY001]
MKSSEMNHQIIFGENSMWCLDIYKRCSVIEESLKRQFEEMLGIDIFEFNKPFEAAYEKMLFAVVCELGGHKGHYNTLHQTDIVYQYAYQEMKPSIFIAHIQDIIQSNDQTGQTKDSITVLQAAHSLNDGITRIKKFMITFLTEVSGNEYLVPFKRFDSILEEITVFIKNRI